MRLRRRRDGTLVADNALDGADRTLDYAHLPAVHLHHPALASVGMTDAAAVKAGLACECRVLLLSAPRALANRDTRGAIRLVAERGYGRQLGTHVLAEGAADVIATAVYALANQMTVQAMASLWCPYLTMAEGLELAAQTFTTDRSQLCCAASTVTSRRSTSRGHDRAAGVRSRQRRDGTIASVEAV